jgi:hypothetical protein
MIFLGGTCGNNDWRNLLFEELAKTRHSTDHLHNPVVPDWNEEVQKREEEAKRVANYHVYFISNPYQDGINISAYSMVEATMALYDRIETTVIVFDEAGVTGHVLKSMQQTKKVLRARFPEAKIMDSFFDLVEFCKNNQ